MIRVLLVDDQALIRQAISVMLDERLIVDK